jgi:hypothetical protein
MSEAKLRKRIRQHLRRRMLYEMKRPSLVSFLFEEEETKAAEGEADAPPKGHKFTGQSNFKDFDDSLIDELFAQIKTKELEQPIFQAMSFQDDDGKTHNPDPGAVASWLESTGEDAVRQRIKDVGGKIPGSGLPKSEMPFLPGPSDAAGSVEDVVDALTPGGKYNIDFKESFHHKDERLIVERWNKLAGLLTEVEPPAKNTLTPGTPETEEYLTSGVPDKDDAVEGDDDANVQQPAKVAAADAIPTQSNILLPKALGMAVGGMAGGDIGAYFSIKGEILDGHHRWAATMLNDPGASLGGFAGIDLEAMGGTTQALKHLTALGNALGNKTKTA